MRDVSDWTVSIDELQSLCPNLEWVTLVVAWFGDDLRAGECTIRPKVDSATKATSGATWKVSGLTRATAETTTLVDGRPAYGGSPSDLSVVRAIEDLKARGLKVTLAPFVLMDIAAGNSLTDPYHGRGGAAGLSLARTHHLRSGAGPAGHAGQDGRGLDRHRALPRRGGAGRFLGERERRFVCGAGGVELSAHDAALRASFRARGRRRRVPDRLGVARA